MMLNGENSLSPSVREELKSFHKLSNDNKQTFAGKMLNNNQKLLVQIVKEPIGSKGPRVSTDITIAGRFLVLIPMGEYIAVSKKITNNKERRRLKSTVGDMLPKGFGVIIRTVAQNQDRKIIEDDMRNVLKKWERILNKLEESDRKSEERRVGKEERTRGR